MRRTVVILNLWLVLVGTVFAGDRPTPKADDAILRGFRFETGETLPSLKLHYFTLGTPRRDASGDVTNAVVLLHGTTRGAESFLQPRFFEALFGSGKPLDLARTYVIIPDAIGGGGSSKPSDGLRAHFPRYGYTDQVRAQHELLGQVGIRHARVVIGASMGGMETWLWAETYPHDADGFVAIASTPAPISGRNMVWREMIAQAIRNDPDWNGGDYAKEKPPRGWLRVAMPLFSIMTSNAETLEKKAPSRQAAIDLVRALAAGGTSRDANDTLYRFESSYDYNPVAKFGSIARPLLSINFADDLLNPPELLHLPTGGSVKGVMISEGTFGHESLAHPEVWGAALAQFLEHLPSSP